VLNAGINPSRLKREKKRKCQKKGNSFSPLPFPLQDKQVNPEQKRSLAQECLPFYLEEFFWKKMPE
jgi:hypothetical protein